MESEFLDWLRNRLPNHPQLRLGPGDDAALLSMVHERHCAVTVDLLSDGIDFDLKRDDPRRLGHKALAVNLSDLAAMAAEPLAVVVALLLPRNNGLAIAKELYEGMLPLAEHHKVCIAGGDTNSWDGSLVISITAIGQVTESGALMRDGAKPGDRIIVTGNFGGSILGKHLDFEPRVRESLHLIQNYKLHAGIDCSDGLSKDLHHLCEEAKCGAVIAVDRIPVSQAAIDLAAKEAGNISALQHALQDGEDFELIMAVPVDDAVSMVRDQPLNKLKLTDIGHFVAEPGLWLQDKTGQKIEIQPKGFEHRFS